MGGGGGFRIQLTDVLFYDCTVVHTKYINTCRIPAVYELFVPNNNSRSLVCSL